MLFRAMETNTRTQRIVVGAYAALYIAAFVDLLAEHRMDSMECGTFLIVNLTTDVAIYRQECD